MEASMLSAEQTEHFSEIELSQAWSSTLQVFCKRLFDVMISLVLLTLLSPLLLALALAVKVSSSGPIFYRWQVAGKDGHPFVGFKFRSMVEDADKQKITLRTLNEMT